MIQFLEEIQNIRDDLVLCQDDIIRTSTENISGYKRDIYGVIKPKSVFEIQRIIQIAIKYKTPLHPLVWWIQATVALFIVCHWPH
jgi:hypothetical protein